MTISEKVMGDLTNIYMTHCLPIKHGSEPTPLSKCHLAEWVTTIEPNKEISLAVKSQPKWYECI